MSTVAPTADTPSVPDAPAATAPQDVRRATPVSRIAIELRKLIDTRGMKVLWGVVLALTVGAFALTLASGENPGLAELITVGMLPLGIFMPVIGLLAISAEWRTRTALWTYTLDPRRTQVFLAKVVAIALAMVLATTIVVVGAAAGTAAAHGTMPSGEDPARLLGHTYLSLAISTAVGVALGAAMLNAPLAITVMFAVPPLLGLLPLAAPTLRDVVPYIDLMSVTNAGYATPYPEARYTTSVLLIWLVAPLVVGVVRNARKEA